MLGESGYYDGSRRGTTSALESHPKTSSTVWPPYPIVSMTIGQLVIDHAWTKDESTEPANWLNAHGRQSPRQRTLLLSAI